ncbi:MAG: ribonuclease III [Planctomycetota bacterium]|nr:ribonuclease III [Planctomycetota bacterium]
MSRAIDERRRRSGVFRHLLGVSVRFIVDDATLAKCQEIISYRFGDVELLRQALTHASAAENRSSSNERMEFLGDAVLGMVICQEIFTRNPDLTEGQMTKIKSSVVSRRTCARVADKLGIAEMLHLGKGVGSTRHIPTSISAAVFESVIGAIYLDAGLSAAQKFIIDHMSDEIAVATASEHQSNYKSLLQQHIQQDIGATPRYDLVDEKGPDHSKCFEVAVRVNGRQYPSAWGKTKKQAEQKAALAALLELGVLTDTDLDSDEETREGKMLCADAEPS